MRVLHGPVNVGNQPWTLSRAERMLGLESDLVVNYSTWLGYPADRVLGEIGNRSWRQRFRRMAFAYRSALSYDVIHYYFGRNFLLWDDLGRAFVPGAHYTRWVSDVWLAKSLGKKLFMTLQGCDVRIAGNSNQRNRWTPCAEGRCGAYSNCRTSYDAGRVAMVEQLLPMMDGIFYLNPELGHEVAAGCFLPYANVDIHAIRPMETPQRKRLRVVHAPSDPLIKGTAKIAAVMERICSKRNVEFVLVQGKTHREAMEIYRSADLAIDQIFAGWYGGFAVELMAMGTPVAAYIREEDRQFVAPRMWRDIPIIRVDPDRLEEDLDAALADREQLREIGRRSALYVREWHDPQKIAEWMVNIYRGAEGYGPHYDRMLRPEPNPD
jgi:hypothetical protein